MAREKPGKTNWPLKKGVATEGGVSNSDQSQLNSIKPGIGGKPMPKIGSKK